MVPWKHTPGTLVPVEGPLYVLGMLDRVRIAESLGEREKAMQSYHFVVDVWHQADPELQPFVVEARPRSLE